jgi:hypothetical protein
LGFCVMVIFCQRETKREIEYVGHRSNGKEK